MFDELKRMNKRQVSIFRPIITNFMIMLAKFYFVKLYYQVLNFVMIVSTALMIWKGLMIVTGSESPVVVVLR